MACLFGARYVTSLSVPQSVGARVDSGKHAICPPPMVSLSDSLCRRWAALSSDMHLLLYRENCIYMYTRQTCHVLFCLHFLGHYVLIYVAFFLTFGKAIHDTGSRLEVSSCHGCITASHCYRVSISHRAWSGFLTCSCRYLLRLYRMCFFVFNRVAVCLFLQIIDVALI